MLFLGSFVLSKDTQNRINRAFFFWCLTVAIWLLFFSISYSTQSTMLANIYLRVGYTFVLFIPIIFYIFLLYFLDLQPSYIILSIIFISYFILAFLTLFTNAILTYPKEYFWGHYSAPGPFYLTSLNYYLIICIFAFYILIRKTFDPNEPPEERNERKYMLLANSIAFIAGIDFLPISGIEIYPFGFIFILIWCCMMSYMIVRKNFFNIEIIIKKSAVYSLFLTIITILYIALVFFLDHLLNSKVNSFVIRFGVVILIALLVSPLLTKVQNIVNRWFLKASPEEIIETNVKLLEIASQSDKMKAVGTLAGGLAHEIKNPLTAIKTFTEHLPRKLDDKEFLQKFSRIVRSEVDRIDDLVNQILEFAKPGPIKTREFSLNKLITDTTEFLSSTFLKHGDKTNLEIDATEGVMIIADRSRIRQALLNLLLNAVESMPEGGTIHIETRREDEKLRAVISDTGKGIAKKDLPHVFDPFYTQKDSGTGLGLAITHNIIKEHGGKIWIESEVKKGTTVFVELPIRATSRH